MVGRVKALRDCLLRSLALNVNSVYFANYIISKLKWHLSSFVRIWCVKSVHCAIAMVVAKLCGCSTVFNAVFIRLFLSVVRARWVVCGSKRFPGMGRWTRSCISQDVWLRCPLQLELLIGVHEFRPLQLGARCLFSFLPS